MGKKLHDLFMTYRKKKKKNATELKPWDEEVSSIKIKDAHP
jgi:hypothetical protein